MRPSPRTGPSIMLCDQEVLRLLPPAVDGPVLHHRLPGRAGIGGEIDLVLHTRVRRISSISRERRHTPPRSARRVAMRGRCVHRRRIELAGHDRTLRLRHVRPFADRRWLCHLPRSGQRCCRPSERGITAAFASHTVVIVSLLATSVFAGVQLQPVLPVPLREIR